MLASGHFLTQMAATEPLAPETIFSIGGFAVTNSMLLGVLVAALIILVFAISAKRMNVRPGSRFNFFIESIVVFMYETLKSNFSGDDKRARKFLALFLGLFVFILLNNLLGLMPGMLGSVYVVEESGVKAALLRPFTTDLNGTLALAVISIGTVQYYAIKERGLFGHVKHYFTVTKPWWNPMNLFLGPLEIMSEFIRLITLAMRLFGVIYAGEVVLGVIAQLSGNFAWLGTLPIIFLEIFFSFIQAYLFIMLSSVYLAMGMTTHEDEEHESSDSSAALVNQTAQESH